MKTRLLLSVSASCLVVASACAAAPMAMPMAKPATASAPTRTASAHVDAAWVRAAPPGAAMMAGYMVVHNDGRTPLRFVSAQSDAFRMVELHKSLIANGMSTMRPAGDQVIAPGGALRIAPGGLHLMLMEPKRALKIGDSVHFRLNFADGSSTDVDATVAVSAPR